MGGGVRGRERRGRWGSLGGFQGLGALSVRGLRLEAPACGGRHGVPEFSGEQVREGSQEQPIELPQLRHL